MRYTTHHKTTIFAYTYLPLGLIDLISLAIKPALMVFFSIYMAILLTSLSFLTHTEQITALSQIPISSR